MNAITNKQELDRLIEDFNHACALVGDKLAAPALLDTLIMLSECKRNADILYVLSKLHDGRPLNGVLDELMDE